MVVALVVVVPVVVELDVVVELVVVEVVSLVVVVLVSVVVSGVVVTSPVYTLELATKAISTDKLKSFISWCSLFSHTLDEKYNLRVRRPNFKRDENKCLSFRRSRKRHKMAHPKFFKSVKKACNSC